LGISDCRAAAAADPLLSLLTGPTEVFQWHGDTFDLPAGAVHLARSARFEHQAFRLKRRVYGVQSHVECSAGIVREWRTIWAAELAGPPLEDRLEQYDGRLEVSLARQRGLAGEMIRHWVGCLAEFRCWVGRRWCERRRVSLSVLAFRARWRLRIRGLTRGLASPARGLRLGGVVCVSDACSLGHG